MAGFWRAVSPSLGLARHYPLRLPISHTAGTRCDALAVASRSVAATPSPGLRRLFLQALRGLPLTYKTTAAGRAEQERRVWHVSTANVADLEGSMRCMLARGDGVRICGGMVLGA